MKATRFLLGALLLLLCGTVLQAQLAGQAPKAQRRQCRVQPHIHALHAQLMQRRYGFLRVITQGIAQRQHPFRHAVLHNNHDSLPGLL